ncbi:hypothetical protein BURPS406E_G0466 [Burkholderia pseudomallei 406e]|nr:hypothetical protein BURPS406E_G0466 [Burkholderia pseudomallei 406e]
MKRAARFEPATVASARRSRGAASLAGWTGSNGIGPPAYRRHRHASRAAPGRGFPFVRQ